MAKLLMYYERSFLWIYAKDLSFDPASPIFTDLHFHTLLVNEKLSK